MGHPWTILILGGATLVAVSAGSTAESLGRIKQTSHKQNSIEQTPDTQNSSKQTSHKQSSIEQTPDTQNFIKQPLNATHVDAAIGGESAATVELVGRSQQRHEGHEKEQKQQRHEEHEGEHTHKKSRRNKEQQERSEERQREEQERRQEESRRSDERQREEEHRQREEEDRQRKREEEEERRYRGRGWCGPDECFSKQGAHCFQEHPVSHCAHMIMVCAKNMIAGCQYKNTDLMLAAVPSEIFSEKQDTFFEPDHSFGSRLRRGVAAIMLVLVATFVTVATFAADARTNAKKVFVESVDGRPLLL